MSGTGDIRSVPVPVKEYRGQRVVTFQDVDAAHQRPAGTARRDFNRNMARFIEGIDYYRVSGAALQQLKINGLIIPAKANRDIILLTEMGYLMLVKSFTDPLSWDVQRALVLSYFRGRGSAPVDFLQSCGAVPLLETETDSALAGKFLKAIGAALQSGEYYLVRTYSRDRSPRAGKMLGRYNDKSISLIAGACYEIYRAYTGTEKPRRSIARKLRPAVERVGLVAPGRRLEIIVDGVTYNAYILDRQAVNNFVSTLERGADV